MRVSKTYQLGPVYVGNFTVFASLMWVYPAENSNGDINAPMSHLAKFKGLS